MSAFTFDVTAFRLAFPAFVDTTAYPTITLQGYWDVAIVYMSDQDYGYLAGNSRLRGLNLLTAHLAYISTLIARGKTPGIVQGSTVDKVTVTLTPPEPKNEFQYWLNTSPYGQALLALLKAWSVGGFTIGGACESAGFRKTYGVF